MRSTLMVMALVAGLGASGRAEQGRFWEPYEPGPNTLVLFHFDGNLNDSVADHAPAVATGAVNFVADGRFGAALRLKGGGVTINLPEPVGPCILEMWLNPAVLPPVGKAVVLVDRGYLPGEQRWAQLLLMSNGSLLWKHSREGSPSGYGDSYALARANAVAAGRWQHLAVVNTGGEETYASRIYVNGRNVTGKPYGNYLGLVPDPRPGNFTLGMFQETKSRSESWYQATPELTEQIGYKPETFVPYEGLIDELRLTTHPAVFTPLPNTSFLDPEKKRPLPQNASLIAGASNLLFYASFDDGADADFSRGDARAGELKRVKLIPGVRGRALALSAAETGTATFSTKENFAAEAGAVSFWVRPHVTLKWPASLFVVGQYYFSPLILVRSIYQQSAPIYPTLELMPCEQWVHVAWSWNAYTAVFYVNGAKAYEVPMWQGPAADPGAFMRLGGWESADYDELKIFDRPLSPAEVGNEYRMYLPGQSLTALPEVGLQVTDFRSSNRLVGSVFARCPVDAVSVRLTLCPQEKNKPLAEMSLPVANSTGTPFVWQLPEEVQAGSFILRTALVAKNDRVVAAGEQPLERKEYEWLKNPVCREDRVLRPFTPMRTERGSTVSVVGRDFRLGRDGLFESIHCWGDDLLAGSMRLEVIEKGAPVSAEGQKVKLTKKSDTRMEWRAESSAAGKRLRIRVEGAMDFDGTTRFILTMAPRKEPVPVNRLGLVIPLKREYADLYCWNIGGFLAQPAGAERQTVDVPWECRLKDGDGEVFSSRTLYGNWFPNNIVQPGWRVPTVGNFIPQVWFGNNDRGVSVFADNDYGWVPNNETPAIQVVRVGAVAELRLNFINSPFTITEPRTIIFGFLPTPVKPFPADWRTGPYIGDFGTPWGSGTSYVADVEDERSDIPGMRTVVEQRHKRGLPSTPHIDTAFFEVGARTRNEFSVDWHAGAGYGPYSMLSRTKVDYMVSVLHRWKRDCGIDGMYFDCATPEPNMNIFSGTAYLLPDGRIQTGWTIWNHRDFFRRASMVFGDLYKGNLLWGNGFYGPEISGWQSATVVGEGCEFYTENNRELIGRHQVSGRDRWSYVPIKYYSNTIPGVFSFQRVHAVSHQWGLIRLWQGPHALFAAHSSCINDPPEVVQKVKIFARSVSAELVQMDTRLMFGGCEFPAYHRDFLKRPGLKFFGFWNNTQCFAREPSSILASAYLADNEILIFASNLTERKMSATVVVDLAALGLPVAGAANAQVADAEKDATWGATASEVYFKNLWTGPTLLPETERGVEIDRADGKLTLRFTIDLKDYRVFRITLR